MASPIAKPISAGLRDRAAGTAAGGSGTVCRSKRTDRGSGYFHGVAFQVAYKSPVPGSSMELRRGAVELDVFG